jgi:RNA polymerase sigma-70 factor (ECF subfamily)
MIRPVGDAMSTEPNMTKSEEFSELLRRYGDTAYRMGLHLSRGNETEARDLVQEAFLRIWRAWPMQRPNSFEGWLYRVLHNLYMDHVRYAQRHPAVSLDAPGPQDTSPWEERLADGSAAPDEPLRQSETKILIARALDRLDAEFRVPVVLCDMEGLSYEEIAHIMACPVGTVRSRIHRAREQLRKFLTASSFPEARI